MEKIKQFLNKNATTILILAIIFYIVILSAVCAWKYYNFGYNALDLAIENQAFYNSSLGDFFKSTLQPPSYSAYHLSPILFLLLPFYLPFKHPLALLILQTIFLAISAWPLYLIAKHNLNKLWGLIIALIFLFNPFVLNINLFEFHFIAFAIFLLFWVIYFYQKEKFLPFIIFVLLSLAVREDVSLVIFMFGILALIDRKKIKWVLFPIVISAVYFMLSMKIIDFYAPFENYQFLIYYSWLGDSWLEIIKNILLKPHLIFLQLFKIGNFELILGFLLPFLFIPLLAPRYLILTLPLFAQYFLTKNGADSSIIFVHYSTLFVPALFVSTILAIKTWQKKLYKNKVFVFLQKEKNLSLMMFLTAAIFSFVVLSPVIGITAAFFSKGLIFKESKIKHELIKEIPKDSSVVASYDFLTTFSSRKNIYALTYVFLGKTQFGQTDYVVDSDVDYLIIDFNDFLDFKFLYNQKENLAPFYKIGDENLLNLISKHNLKLIKVRKNYALYKKDANENFELLKIYDTAPDIKNKNNINLENKITFLGYNVVNKNNLELFWQAKKNIDQDLHIEIISNNKRLVLPLGYGMLPTSKWQEDQIVQTNYWFEREIVPNNITIQIAEYFSIPEFSLLRGIENKIENTIKLGPHIKI